MKESQVVAKNESDQTQKKDSDRAGAKQVPAKPQNRPSQYKKISESELKEHLSNVAVKYGLDFVQLDRTIQGESTYDQNKDNGLSVGIAQYILTTWLANCSKKDERKDPIKSLDCMGKMWAAGNAYQWDSYCNLYKDTKCEKLRGLYVGFLNK